MGTHAPGETSEEFGIPRIEGIANAVFSRQRYTLVRPHSPDPREELVFDFSSCAGTVKEAVLALVAVEKVFRMVADPRAGDKDAVAVDPKVDAFLRDHFTPYARYFSHRVDGQGPGAPIRYSHLREDEQYDDLTILVMRRK